MTGDSNSDDIAQLTEKLIGPLENKINELTKKTFKSFWQEFQYHMATASEPFFRKEMGERYFSSTNLFVGTSVWAGGTLLAMSFSFIRSPFTYISAVGFENFSRFLGSGFVTFLVGAVMVGLSLYWGTENLRKMLAYREDCIAYHTRSRGTPRWGGDNGKVFLLMSGVLFIFNFPVFVLFMFSHGLATKLAAERDAAIYSRYFDILDQQIEKEYLEKAILGQCPTEITQLSSPLPQNLKEQYRKNVAAAATGKTVKIVAQPPQPGSGFQPPPPLPPDDTIKPVA